MQVESFSSPLKIPEDVLHFLSQDEIRNNVSYGILTRLKNNPDAYKEKYLYVVRDGNDKVCGYAHWTPPYAFCLAKQNQSSLDALAEFIETNQLNIDAIHGLRTQVEYLFQKLNIFNDKKLSEDPEGCYFLQKVKLPNKTLSKVRLAQISDLDIITEWTQCFGKECDLVEDPQDARVWAESRIQDQVIFVGEVDGKPVCCTAMGRTMPHGRCVSFVYTPKEFRKNGYASHIVAEVSQKVLDMGYQYACLFTQLKNPTSNKIYQEIGYQWVDEFMVYRF